MEVRFGDCVEAALRCARFRLYRFYSITPSFGSAGISQNKRCFSMQFVQFIQC